MCSTAPGEERPPTPKKCSTGGSWSGNPYVDLGTGVKQKNHFLIYQDTYIFGRGYLGMTKVKVPEKYFQIR